MNTTTTSVAHEQFVKDMDAERIELGRLLRDGDYKRAWAVAVYISHEIARRPEFQREPTE